MDVDTDPKKVILEASNDLKEWYELYNSDLIFYSRNKSQDFVISANEVSYKHYAISFERQTASSAMHVGNYGILESYAKQCAANIYNDIVGSNVLPYKAIP